ncbi:MAG: DUF4383 domain-containing protein [Nitrospirae bacterium]|nr:DUF4383 domain-containing protein [Nitrospirota bacterium]MDA1304484.1 DUF4383 domain-containing protein [Nitrospirota bacterium]
MLNSKTICIAFGSVFVLVGLLGFIPNPIVSSEGMFETNVLHNFVHLLTGAAFRFGSVVLDGKENLTLKAITVAYFGVALLGFFTEGNMLLGMVHINEADRWLHLGLAMAMVVSTIGASQLSTQLVASSHA